MTLLVFAATALASAVLMFMVEPLLAKMLLPALGGAPAVWNSALVFFQATLLAGYAAAHGLARLGPRRHAAAHLAMFAAASLALPIALRPALEHAPPALRVIALLGAAAGVPFFVLAASTPTLGRLLGAIDRPDARDPYLLYAASNAGSLLSLALYPLVVEPRVGIAAQARGFGVAWGVLFALFAACAALVLRGPRKAPIEARVAAPIGWARRGRWVLLAAVPSALLVAVTQYLTTDVAAAPLLWAAPLLVYLATMVLAFAPRLRPRHALVARLLPLPSAMVALTLVLETRAPAAVIALVHLALFGLAAMLCHGALADDRPEPARLTELTLWISVGGVVGGLAVALVAPVVLDRDAEYPALLVLALALRPAPADAEGARKPEPSWPKTLAFAAAIGAAGVAAILVARRFALEGSLLAACVSAPVFAMYRTQDTPRRFALALGAFLLAGALHQPYGETVLRARGFFGALRVARDPTGRFVQLVHGTTIHGRQALDPAARREPLTYYHRTGPVGDVLARHADAHAPAEARVGVIGLGAGSVATYARAGEPWTFWEIDPDVIRVARDPRWFTFLSDAFPRGEGLRVEEIDARLGLAASRETFTALVIDAFSSDAIPVHLLTEEAMGVYVSHLAERGLMAWHVSNNYLDLEPVLAALAERAGLVAFVRRDWDVSDAERARGKSPSTWVAMARAADDLGELGTKPPWVPARRRAGIDAWTDDRSSVVTLLLHQ